MKSANWISGTGTRPCSAMPIAVPTMPPSESGVSMTRASPNSSQRPWVTRKTPPTLPTSSPRITTRSSRRISWRSASLMACTRLSCIGDLTSPPLLLQVPRRMGVHVVEERARLRLGGCRGLGQGAIDVGRGVGLEPSLAPLVPEAPRLEVAAHAHERVDAVHPGDDRLDERGPPPVHRALARLAHHAQHGQDVRAVDANAVQSVGDGLDGDARAHR